MMKVWPILIFMVVSLVLFSKYRVLRAFLLALGALSLVLVLYFEVFEDVSNLNSKISVDQIKVDNALLKKRTAHSYIFTGNIFNLSKEETMVGFEVLVRLKDCSPVDDIEMDCHIAGQREEFIRISIDPKQSQDFSQRIYFYNASEITNEMHWDYKIKNVRAR